MILNPYSYNGTSLQSTDYATGFPRAQADLQIQAQLGYVKRAGAVPVFAGKDFQPHTLNLEMNMLHDTWTLFESVNQLFDVQDETPRQFICTDTEDTDKQYYVYATPKQVLGGHDGTMALVTLALDDPIWQSVTQNSQTFSTTAASDSTSVIAAGNADSYPIFEVTPTSAPSTDFIYSVYLQVLPQSTRPWNNRPVCITSSSDGTFDTAALVAAGKMQADGDDLRVFKNGVATDFWVSGINTTDTKVWVVANMPEARNAVLKTAIGATDTVTEIEINYTAAGFTAITAMPNTGLLILDTTIGSTDTEEFVYSNRTVTDTKLSFTIVARNYRNTTAVDHAAGSNVRYLPYGFRIDYGSDTATAPTIDDTTKPIINLSTSSNASFVYANFYETTAQRAGIWRPSLSALTSAREGKSTWYTSTNDEGDTDPATAMGFKAQTYESGGLWRPDSVAFLWAGSFPDYVTTFSATGAQSQSTASWLTVGMAYATENSYKSFWTLSAQSATDYGTFTTWTKATSDATVPASIDALYWRMDGSVLGSTDVYSKAEASAVTVNLTNYPHVMIRSEKTSIAKINCTIGNSTTGESFQLTIPVEVNDTVYIDTDPEFPTVKYNSQIVNGAIKLSTIRSAWLKLSPGTNTITLANSQAVANDFSIVIKWRDRANFF